ncbi:MAG: TlpA family protein disulfide reductase [Polyangiales bacterium]
MSRLLPHRFDGPCATLVAALLLAAGCSERREVKPATGRVVAVTAGKDVTPQAGFCDVAGRPQLFTWPPLANAAKAPTLRGGLHWVNVWATWCKPCVEEMPTLRQWQGKWRQAGLPVKMHFLSADSHADALQRHQRQHPRTPASLRIAESAELEDWLTTLGLDASAAIPLQIIVDKTGRRRCVRAGPVKAEDFAGVERLLRSWR